MKKIDDTKLVDAFFNNSQKAKGNPKAVIVMGGVGSGKTAVRCNDYQTGYVQVDGADIFAKLAEEKDANDVRKYLPVINRVGKKIVKRAIKEKRNLVIEMTGEDELEIMALVAHLEGEDYTVKIQYIECDPGEAYKRHLKAVESDYRYLSSYITAPLHAMWVSEATAGD